jgi:predicted ABC-type sugar transport system permease subunit
MAAVSHDPARFARSRLEWLELPAFWGALTIVTVWLAVLFVGVFGPSITSHSGVDNIGNGSSVPSVVVVAPCAVLATWLIARNAFRCSSG